MKMILSPFISKRFLLTGVQNQAVQYLSEGRHIVMAVPSSEFTFSMSSQSAVVYTPSSSSRDSSNEGNPVLTPHTPRTIHLFENLSLNDPPGPMNSPSSGSADEWVSLRSPPATYGQQHNASPSPRPGSVPPSHGRQISRRNRSVCSSSTQAYACIPGAFPASSTGEVNHLSENEATGRDEASDYDERSDMEETIEAQAVGIREEPLPDAPVFNRRLQDSLKEVKGGLAVLADTMRFSELNQDHSSALHALFKQTKKMSMFEYPVTRTVGFIGESGVGIVPRLPFLLL